MFVFFRTQFSVLKHSHQITWNNKSLTWIGVWIPYYHYNSLVPQVCFVKLKESPISFQGIRGYISVTTTLKFTYFLINGIMFANLRVKSTRAVPSGCAVYGRSPAAIVGSNPTGGMGVCLLCVVRLRSLRRTDQSSRGVLQTVACRCVWSRSPCWAAEPEKMMKMMMLILLLLLLLLLILIIIIRAGVNVRISK
jgi:hypothetical protein